MDIEKQEASAWTSPGRKDLTSASLVDLTFRDLSFTTGKGKKNQLSPPLATTFFFQLRGIPFSWFN